jgi:hypothetical protein
VPFDCRHRAKYGPEACLRNCPTLGPEGRFRFTRVETPDDLPAIDERTVEIAVLDMHHGWPNLGHDAIVHGVQNAVCDLQDRLAAAGLSVAVISYDVRRGHQIPEGPGGRHTLYLGTGGPGHLDPSANDGVTPGSQGIREDPGWETPLFDLFTRIRGDEDAALLGVCHTFGVVCRWLGAADAVLREGEKGGKSAGLVQNVLTDAAREHPWFGRFSRELPDRRRFRVLDSRLYDLVPRATTPASVTWLATEALGLGGPSGSAVTMIEAARDRDGVMPRILAVNHHPEIVNRPRQLTILKRKVERRPLGADWYEERVRSLTETIPEGGDHLLDLTSSYTLLAPLRFYLYRAIRLRARAIGAQLDLHESMMPLAL